MKFTPEKPTVPGLYWYHQQDGTIESIELYDDLTTDTGATINEIIEWWRIDAWAGPVEPPEFDL